jgi:hypothetical protein
MSKIEFDAAKVYTGSAASRLAAEKERIYRKYADALEKTPDSVWYMDETTKSAIEELLKTVRKRPPEPPSMMDTMGERAARLRRDELEREERRKREYIKRLEEDAARRRLERARYEEEQRIAAQFKALAEPPDLVAQHALKQAVAALSVNSAKACVVVRCELCAELVDQITREIPAPKRSWNGIDRVFEFHPSAMAQVRGILALYFKDVQVVGVPKAIPATKFDKLLAKLSKDDKASIYKLLAMRYHPDRKGDHEVMTLINQVFKEK